jgi:Septin
MFSQCYFTIDTVRYSANRCHRDIGTLYYLVGSRCRSLRRQDKYSVFSLKPMDVACMKALDHKVNIVPVIAKADTLTRTELQKLKSRVRSCDPSFCIMCCLLIRFIYSVFIALRVFLYYVSFRYPYLWTDSCILLVS